LLGHLLLALGMLSAFTVPVCAAVAHAPGLQTTASGPAGAHARSSAAAEKELKQAFALRNKLKVPDLQVAIRLFSASAQQFQASGAPRQAAYAELEAGDTYLMMSSYHQALAAYRRSLALAANLREPRCAALSHIARTYASIGRAQDAARYSGSAVALCEGGSDKKALADAVEAEGEAHFWSDMAAAVAPFTRARQLFAEANDRDGEALASMMLGQAINTADPEQADRLIRTALNLWEKTGNRYGVARAHLALGFFASEAGSFEVARCHCGRALAVFQPIADKDNKATALNILGLVARQFGDMEGSLSDYRRARSDYAAVQDDLGEAESITGMGAALMSQHKYGGLLPLYRLKLRLGQKARNDALVASALMDMAAVYVHQHRYQEADLNYEQALAKYRAAGSHFREGEALTGLAGLRTEQGKDSEALDLLDQARQLTEKTGQVEDMARIQYARAQIYRRMNRLDEARAEIEKTIAVIESQRLRLTEFDSRAQYFAFVHQYYSLYIQVLMGLHQLHPDQGYMQLAFEAAEKSKVRALLDLLENTRQAFSCDELLARDSNAAPPAAGKQAGTPGAASARPLTLQEIQAEIGDSNTVLLEYALGDEKSYAWSVDRENISVQELPPAAEIRRSALAFREALMPLTAPQNETASEHQQKRRAAERSQLLHSRELAKILLGGLDLPAGTRVLVVPDGPLQYVPFAALPAQGGEADKTFFIAQHDVTMLPSASALAALRKAAAKRPQPSAGIAIFADPVFEKSQISASANAATGVPSQRSHDLQRALQDTRGSQHIVRLWGSRTEALEIQRIVGREHTRLALGFDASRGAVINGSLAHNRVIHFATHGIVDTRHPELSGLILSLLNRKGERQDGYLRLGDIYNLQLSADLVVLSSCDSALGKDMESEGIIGLPRGFLYAGARSVIASLWKVDDDATAALMKGLYSRMRQGKTPQTALRESQLELAKDPLYRQPYYWAAFVLEGEYRWQAVNSKKH
jgi:CHAT domain-containing protein